MDYQIRQIENYYLTEKNSRDLVKNVRAMGPKELHEIFRKSSVPKTKSRKELLHEIKHHKSWKNPGPGNKEFNPVIALKAKVLNCWDISRVNMPERSYERYPVNKKFQFVGVGSEFGYKDINEDSSEQYRKYLKAHTEKFNDYVQRPSKYETKSAFLPQILMSKDPFYVKKVDYLPYPRHNTVISELKFRTKQK